MSVAGVAHPVERHLAKVEVASSSLVTRSIKKKQMQLHLLLFYFGDDGSKNQLQVSSGHLLAPRLDGGNSIIFAKGKNANEPRHPSRKIIISNDITKGRNLLIPPFL